MRINSPFIPYTCMHDGLQTFAEQKRDEKGSTTSRMVFRMSDLLDDSVCNELSKCY